MEGVKRDWGKEKEQKYVEDGAVTRRRVREKKGKTED